MAFETLTDQVFYSPWPKFGKKLSHQWGEIRQNQELLKPIAENAIYEADANNLKGGVLAGFDFGEEDFSNRFRLIWQANDDTFLFQCNAGTEAVPVWDTAFYIDCVDDNIVFLKDSVFTQNNSFQTTFKETEIGGASVAADVLKVDSSFFYLSSSSGDDKPILSLHSSPGGGGISSVTFKESESGGASFSSDTLSVDSSFFYLSSGGDGKPVLSYNRPVDEKSLTVLFPGRNEEFSFFVPARPITVKKAFTSLVADDAGFYPSIRWNIRYSTSRFDTGTELITDGHWLDFYPNANEEVVTAFDNPNIPAENRVWLQVMDLGEGGGTEEQFHITLHFEDQ